MGKIVTSDTSVFGDLVEFVRLAVKDKKLKEEWKKIVEKHGTKLGIDRWVEE